ncbi:MAG: hypothetical protein WEE89_18285 [Gemmatimonadota bacterium]
MNAVLLVLALNLHPGNASVSQRVDRSVNQEQRYPDEWFAQDKLQHAFMSMAVVGFAHAGARLVGIEKTGAVVVGVSSSAISGLWKEWHDRRIGRPFSYRDLVWDALGIAAGALVMDNVRE